MTKTERATMRRALHQIMGDTEFHEGLVALCRLAGFAYPAAAALAATKTCDLTKLAAMPNRAFCARGENR